METGGDVWRGGCPCTSLLVSTGLHTKSLWRRVERYGEGYWRGGSPHVSKGSPYCYTLSRAGANKQSKAKQSVFFG